MNVLGLDPTAQALAVAGAGAVLLGIVLIGIVIGHFRRERDDARETVAVQDREILQLKALNAGLLAGSEIPALRANLAAANARAARALGDRDKLMRQLVEAKAEAAELQGMWRQERAELTKQVADLRQALQTQVGDRL